MDATRTLIILHHESLAPTSPRHGPLDQCGGQPGSKVAANYVAQLQGGVFFFGVEVGRVGMAPLTEKNWAMRTHGVLGIMEISWRKKNTSNVIFSFIQQSDVWICPNKGEKGGTSKWQKPKGKTVIQHQIFGKP